MHLSHHSWLIYFPYSFFRLVFTWRLTMEIVTPLQTVRNTASILIFPSAAVFINNKNNFLEKQRRYSRVSEITRARELFCRFKLHAVIDSHIWSHLPVRSRQLLHSSAGPWIFSSCLSPHASYSWFWQLKQQCICASDVQRLGILDWANWGGSAH